MPGAAPPRGRRPGPGGRLTRGRQALRSLAATGRSLPGGPAVEPVADPAPSVVQIVVQGGLVKRLSDTDGALNWVLNGEQLQLVTVSAIPVKDFRFSGNVQLAENAPLANEDFGVGPVGCSAATSRPRIPSRSPPKSQPIPGSAGGRQRPAALWQTRDFDRNGVPVGVDPLNSTTIKGVYTGFTLTPLVSAERPRLSLHPQPRLPDRRGGALRVDRRGRPGDRSLRRADRLGDDHRARPASQPRPAGRGRRRARVARARPDRRCRLSSRAAYDLLANPVLRLLGEQR